MLKEEDLAAWFATQGITTPFWYDSISDLAPVNVAAISISGGLGLTLDDKFDRPTFNIMTRGSDGGVAVVNARAIDEAWLNGPVNFSLGGYWVVGKGRLGGPPAYVATDAKNRVLRSATYWVQIER
jgi:hypothetical protein